MCNCMYYLDRNLNVILKKKERLKHILKTAKNGFSLGGGTYGDFSLPPFKKIIHFLKRLP